MCSKEVETNGDGGAALSRFSILVGFICASSYFGAFVGTGWVYTKESYRLINLNLYTSVTFKIGLWRACHSFKRINSTIILPTSVCTSISYSNWSDISVTNLSSNSDIESTLSVLNRIRWSTIFVGLGLILVIVGLLYSILGHYYQDNKTLLASAIYTLSGLSLAAGLFIFVCVLTDSFVGHLSSYDRQNWDVFDPRQSRDYKYGWCFITSSAACIFVELVAVLCITVHYRRCQTIAQVIKDIMPLIEDKTTRTYFSASDTGCLVKAEETSKSESKVQTEDNSNGTLSETPPDICSTFLNNDLSEEDIDTNTPKEPDENIVHCLYKNKKGNFATLNSRNYRCSNYPVPTNKRYSTLGGCKLSSLDGPCSSSASASNTFSNFQYHQAGCVQNTVPRIKACNASSNKYHIVEKSATKILEAPPLCEDINL